MSSASDHFWKKVATAFSGVVVAQAIPIIGSLAIARLYAPSEFGLYASWLGIVTMLSVVLTGRFEMSLAVVADGRPRVVAVWATLATNALGALAMMGAGAMALALFPSVIAPFSVAQATLIIPTAFCFAAAKTWQSWAAASGKLRVLSAMRITQATIVTVTQIVVGWFASTALGLAAAYLFGIVIGLVVSALMMPLPIQGAEERASLAAEVKRFWRAYRRFPILSLPADAISAFSAMLPLIILANRFGAEVSGILALTIRVLGAPISLLGTAVLDVFWRASGASFREHGHCRDDYWRTFKVLALGSLAVSLVIVGFSEQLFVIAFGEQWRESGVFAAWLMPMFALSFVASPLSYVFYVAGKQHVDLGWQLGVLGMTVATMAIPHHYAAAIQTYSIGYGLLYVIYLALSWQFSKGVRQ